MQQLVSLIAGFLGFDQGLLQCELRPYPGKNDGARERLVYVIHGTDTEALLLVDLVDLGGKKDDGNVARPRVVLELAADLIAVHARHHHVEQDQVWLLGAGRDGQRLLSVGCHLGPERVLQHAGDDGNICRRVVDDQHELAFVARHYLPSRWSDKREAMPEMHLSAASKSKLPMRSLSILISAGVSTPLNRDFALTM